MRSWMDKLILRIRQILRITFESSEKTGFLGNWRIEPSTVVRNWYLFRMRLSKNPVLAGLREPCLDGRDYSRNLALCQYYR